MTRTCKVAAMALPLVLLARAASAQAVAGIPVYYNAGGGSGVSAAANVGKPNSDAGGGAAYALTGALALNRLYLTASVGSYNPEGPTGAENTFGGTASLRIFGGLLMPVSVAVQGGVSVFKAGGVTQTEIPIGVAIAPSVPLFPIKPWIAPRVQLSRLSGSGSSTNATSVGLSAGVNFNMLLGLGVHAAVDIRKVSRKIDADEPTAVILGVGAHFNFRVPMM
ncbi:MAG: hypothetical protein HY705_04555 [Gemmatimonadetes bacterium]|nr:hypothetical protein [Gemmatimonadota bacterium]